MKVQLISHTENPQETIFALWKASRSDDVGIAHPFHLFFQRKEDAELDAAIDDLWAKMLQTDLPLMENIWFTFLLHDVSIAFREQMVRHRVGIKVGERLGCDLIPNLTDSTWWSQTMRIMDMGKFAENKKYQVPDTVKIGPMANQIMKEAMQNAAHSYNQLRRVGVPPEDARGVIPLAATHRISWTLNLAALKHVVGKRTCWIVQSNLWLPVIEQMINELTKHVHPSFRSLADPPCFKQGEWSGCPFKIENHPRISGKDPYPPCSLYLGNESKDACDYATGYNGGPDAPDPKWCPIVEEGAILWDADKASMQLAQEMEKRFSKMWQRNPLTGERIQDETK